MKVSIFFFVTLVVYTYGLKDDEIAQKWRQFQVDYGKTYRSPIEAKKRFNIFKQNVREIDEHNLIYDVGVYTYKKGINQFADWSKQEFQQYVNKGFIGRPSRLRQFVQHVGSSKSSDLPESVDWRQKGIVSPVKDQGRCGSCWAFSAVGAIEAQLAQKQNLTVLSEQNIIDCSWDEGNQGCDGGWMTEAFDYVKENGIESEADYPYLAYDDDCAANSSKVITKIKSYVEIKAGDENDLQNAIANKGPVAVAIDASWNFQLYSNGVLIDDDCSSDSLNHGVLAVGYGSEDGKDYYIIKNSWGDKWGEAGYLKLARNSNNMCGIASVASYPEI
ncbi:hypothetical protein WA026_000231 [Henosepilachna vigintioctopunctata]|uniref:Uncharacterized protein n=1 Tax=Henosepilachna vigintioctopunctata TaxID=420089 RepID=A0AAW1V4G9_9CUCU